MKVCVTISAKESDLFAQILNDVKEHLAKNGGCVTVEIYDGQRQQQQPEDNCWTPLSQIQVIYKLIDFCTKVHGTKTTEHVAKLVGIDRGDLIRYKNGNTKLGPQVAAKFLAVPKLPKNLAKEIRLISILPRNFHQHRKGARLHKK